MNNSSVKSNYDVYKTAVTTVYRKNVLQVICADLCARVVFANK